MVQVPSPKRKRLLIAFFVLVFLFVSLVIADVIVSKTKNTSLSGQVSTIVGTVVDNKVAGEEGRVAIKDGENTYCVSVFVLCDYLNEKNGQSLTIDEFVQEYMPVGHAVKVVVPQVSLDSNSVWALGLEKIQIGTTDNVIADYNDVINMKLDDVNRTLKILFVVTAAIGVIACAIFIYRLNCNKLVEIPLTNDFAKFSALMQPLPKIKWYRILNICISSVVVVLCVVLLVLTACEVLNDVGFAIGLGVLFIITVADIVWSILSSKMIKKIYYKNYCKNFPFDSTVLPAFVKKEIRDVIEPQIKKEREENPDSFSDSTNPYEMKFTETGVEFYRIVPPFMQVDDDGQNVEKELSPEEMKEIFEKIKQASGKAEDIFELDNIDGSNGKDSTTADDDGKSVDGGDIDDVNNDGVVVEVNSEKNVASEKETDNASEKTSDTTKKQPKVKKISRVLSTPQFSLSYNELDFEAVDFYGVQMRPLVVVIKSRLVGHDSDFENDIHMSLDINLLKTLKKFNVPVEKLDEILLNKENLMAKKYLKKKVK